MSSAKIYSDNFFHATRLVDELNSQPESSVPVLGFDPVCGVSRVEASTRLSSGGGNYSWMRSAWVWCTCAYVIT